MPLMIKLNRNIMKVYLCLDNDHFITVDRWFPSSKTCHCCKHIKKDLKLSDRVFRCDCGYIEDRDFNAALNLRDATTYEVA
ncbi:zinc ribbon domain-containing protein [Catenibacterium mitsuokai]|uniref:zinc ribbon domain-containing protein n=2 Tax=Catenibacterium mitsuokai TaxID=100886 RepID=UPI003F891A3F